MEFRNIRVLQLLNKRGLVIILNHRISENMTTKLVGVKRITFFF
jgi:hypothetical protein